MPGSPAPPSGWPAAAGRSSMTVAASRGVTGATVPSSTSRARSANCGGSRIAGRAGGSVMGLGGGASRDLYDQLDLDRRVERQHSRTDRAASVPARLAEHLKQQLTGTVHDLRLAGEIRGAGH